MSRLAHLALLVAALAVFVLLLERHATLPELQAERQRAHLFAGVIAECANGRNFEIDGTLVKCRPMK